MAIIKRCGPTFYLIPLLPPTSPSFLPARTGLDTTLPGCGILLHPSPRDHGFDVSGWCSNLNRHCLPWGQKSEVIDSNFPEIHPISDRHAEADTTRVDEMCNVREEGKNCAFPPEMMSVSLSPPRFPPFAKIDSERERELVIFCVIMIVALAEMTAVASNVSSCVTTAAAKTTWPLALGSGLPSCL